MGSSDKVFIYALKGPGCDSVRYIGKADDVAKRLKSHIRDSRRRKTPVYDWMRKLAAAGMTPEIVVISECQRDCWETEERRLIAEARSSGASLLNLADGGDQPHCPIEVLRRNSRHLNAPEIRGFRIACKRLAEGIRIAKKGKNSKLLDKCTAALARLRSMSKDEKVRFSLRFLETRYA